METLKLVIEERKTLRVEIANKVTGKDTIWELREMTSKERDTYLNQFNQRVVYDEKGNIKSITEHLGMHYELVGKCMHPVTVDGDGGEIVQEKKISRDEFDSFPVAVQIGLFQACNDVNRLTPTKEGEEANPKKD